MFPLLLIAPLVAIAAGAANRRRIANRVEREYATLFPSGADGIVLGAESIRLAGTNGKALLLLHGSGDTPQSMRYLAERLHKDGFTVHALLLPGHGRSPRAFAAASAEGYYRAARAELDALRAANAWVGIVGLSMGGAIGARLTAEEPDVRLLVLLAPYLTAPRMVRVARGTSPLWMLGAPYVGGRGDHSIHDERARAESRAYGTFSPGALAALVESAEAGWRSLRGLRVPVLVVNSEHDNRIPRANAEAALAELPPSAERHWVTGCGHVITVDYCKDAVARLVSDFLARHAGVASGAARG